MKKLKNKLIGYKIIGLITEFITRWELNNPPTLLCFFVFFCFTLQHGKTTNWEIQNFLHTNSIYLSATDMAGMTSTQEQHTLNQVPRDLGNTFLWDMDHGPTLFVPFSSQKVPTCRLYQTFLREREKLKLHDSVFAVVKSMSEFFLCIWRYHVTKYNFTFAKMWIFWWRVKP